MQSLPEEFIKLCKSVTLKRPKTVIDHILEHGFITTEELKEKYGYNHPPRAVRDVKEQGIPIVMYKVRGSDGRSIAAYKFGDPSKARATKLSGRTALSRDLKERLIASRGARCFIYLEKVDERELQVDHRVPFEVGGEPEPVPENFMLLCSSANRAKSWSCEHCRNWLVIRDKGICRGCYWAYPESYDHVAMKPIRRVDLLWEGKEVVVYRRIKNAAVREQKDIPKYIKDILDEFTKKP